MIYPFILIERWMRHRILATSCSQSLSKRLAFCLKRPGSALSRVEAKMSAQGFEEENDFG
jgi:hypothetical protein